MKTCPKCSTQWPDDAAFCPMHGIKLIEVKEQPPPAPVEAKAKPTKSRVDFKTETGTESALREKKQGGRQWFSETKWFQEGDKIKEKEVTPEDVPLDELDKIYTKTSELPDEVRKKYSLSYKEEKKEK